jgi:hypothetical protein
MIRWLPPSSLLVADIGFGGFDLLWKLCHAKVNFLIRTGGSTMLLVEHTLQQIVRRGDVRYVYLWPGNRRKKCPLQLRLIVLKRRGHQPVYLLTNVLEPTRLSRGTAGRIYQARWSIEVEYRGLKQTMGHGRVLARMPEAGAMELAGNLLAQALLLMYAALVLATRLTRLSLAKAIRVIRRAIEALRYDASCRFVLRQLDESLVDNYERHSSKRARDWPHKKNESPPGPPKLRRLKTRERAKIRRLLMLQAAGAT